MILFQIGHIYKNQYIDANLSITNIVKVGMNGIASAIFHNDTRFFSYLMKDPQTKEYIECINALDSNNIIYRADQEVKTSPYKFEQDSYYYCKEKSCFYRCVQLYNINYVKYGTFLYKKDNVCTFETFEIKLDENNNEYGYNKNFDYIIEAKN